MLYRIHPDRIINLLSYRSIQLADEDTNHFIRMFYQEGVQNHDTFRYPDSKSVQAAWSALNNFIHQQQRKS